MIAIAVSTFWIKILITFAVRCVGNQHVLVAYWLKGWSHFLFLFHCTKPKKLKNK